MQLIRSAVGRVVVSQNGVYCGEYNLTGPFNDPLDKSVIPLVLEVSNKMT